MERTVPEVLSHLTLPVKEECMKVRKVYSLVGKRDQTIWIKDELCIKEEPGDEASVKEEPLDERDMELNDVPKVTEMNCKEEKSTDEQLEQQLSSNGCTTTLGSQDQMDPTPSSSSQEHSSSLTGCSTPSKMASSIWEDDYEKKVFSILKTMRSGRTESREVYHIRSTFEISSIEGIERAIRKTSGRVMITKSKVQEAIKLAHISLGHAGEKRTWNRLKETYDNIPKQAVREFIAVCKQCIEKRKRKKSTGTVARPSLFSHLNQRGYIDLVDMQSQEDGPFRFIMHYQEQLSKFHFIRPLTSKCAAEIAKELLLIFLDVGAPVVLQSDSGREFTAEVIQELSLLWPEIVLVNGCPKYTQSSAITAIGVLKEKLKTWMQDQHCPKWSLGVRFVQWQMNTCMSDGTKTEPYKLMFSKKPMLGLSSILPQNILDKTYSGITEEALTEMFPDATLQTTLYESK